MNSTLAARLAGVFLILYGLGSIAMSAWAYTVTHAAYESVRTFTTAYDRERAQAAEALQRVAGLGGRRDGNSSGSSSNSGPAVARGADSLRDRLRGILGGSSGGSSQAQPAATPTPSATPRTGDGSGLLGQLETAVGELGGGWTRLGDGPLPTSTLNRVELATNAVLAWMATHGIASIIIGIVLLSRRRQPVPAPVPVAAPATYRTDRYGPDPYAQPGASAQPGAYVRPDTQTGTYVHPDDRPTLQIDGLPRSPRRHDE